MPAICIQEGAFSFPPLNYADEEGLLLIGGKVTQARVIEAYLKGIFPWYNDEGVPLWWSPDPRFVLFPGELHISKSMRKLLLNGSFEFRLNSAFENVIDNCASVKRKEADGTWILPEMKKAYLGLHNQGFAISGEAWQNNKLAGGVYGILIDRIFFAESMFHTESNASKFALISLVNELTKQSIQLIDCQVYTSHVETLGARNIPRAEYIKLLQKLTANYTQG